MSKFENMTPRFSNLAGRLLSGGVAPRHVRRTIAELQDHYVDLHEEAVKRGLSQQSAEADALSRLGKEEDLVAEVLAKPELRSWASRWPWAVYGLGPVVMMSAAVVSSILAFAAGMTAGKYITGGRYIPPVWAQQLVEGLFFLVVYALPIVIAALVCRQVVLRRASLGWPLAGLIVLCVISAAFDIGGTWPATPEAEGILEVGFAYAAPFPLTVETFVRAVANISFSAVFMTWCRVRTSY
jgi:lambda repressor-like predicted transcriptional regulator